MDNQPTTEQLEAQELERVISTLQSDIELGKDLKSLRKRPEFQRVFDALFISDGKTFLWDNITHLEEEVMIARKENDEVERAKDMISRLKRQVDGRLVFESYIDTIEHDAENAVEALLEMNEGKK